MSYGNDECITIKILNNNVALDQSCWSCDGGKQKPDLIFADENGICEQCNGTGYILTSVGESILKLIERHG